MKFRKKPIIIFGLIFAITCIVYEKNSILTIIHKNFPKTTSLQIKNNESLSNSQNSNQSPSQNSLNTENNFDVQNCGDKFFNKTSPIFPNYLLTQSQFICYHHYGVLASGLTKTGLISAEYLTKEDVQNARTLERKNTFHQDPFLNPQWAANENDYKRTGYDRGHLTPSGDEPNQEDQYETFSMANMAPQNPKLNRGNWEHIEAKVRDEADNDGTYILTGIMANSSDPSLPNTTIIIPDIYYKAIFEPSKNYCGIWIAQNIENGEIIETSFEKFYNTYKINLFPSLKETQCYTHSNLPYVKIKN